MVPGGHGWVPSGSPVGPQWVPGRSPVGPWWVPGGSLFASHYFFKPRFWYMLAGSWSSLCSMFGDVSNCLASLSGTCHLFNFYTDLGMDLMSFLMLFDDFPFVHSPCETFKNTCLYNELE